MKMIVKLLCLGAFLTANALSNAPLAMVNAATPVPPGLGIAYAVLSGHTADITALAWSPDGKLLASAANDKSVRLWGSDGVLRATFDDPDQSICWLS